MIKLFEFIFYLAPARVIDLFQSLWVSIGIKPVVLGSDLLIYVLMLVGSIWFYTAIRREYWRVALRQVISNRVAMLCFGVLCVYVLIGFTDTLHYREVSEDNPRGGPILSVLDSVCGTLFERTEKTYSAPLATHSFSKETYLRADGTQYREYPPLKYGGQHLKSPDDRGADIAFGVVKGLGWGIGLGAIALVFGLLLVKKLYREPRSGGGSAVSGVWIAAGLLLIAGSIVGIAVELGGKYHLFGTDKAGQDVFYTTLKSVRTGLVVGTLTTLIVTPFAILFGVMAGYFGGWVDDAIQYVYTTLSSIPSILLIAAAMLTLQVGMKDEETIISADKRLVYLCLIMGITSWTGLCRLLRAEVLKLKEIEYIQAADAFGVSRWVIMARHLVPNVMHIVLISIILRFSGLVLAEAVLSYVGVGVDPSMQSWGNMINQARLELAREPAVWWSLVAAFVFMFGLVLPANLFGDAVRDALDPRLRTQ